MAVSSPSPAADHRQLARLVIPSSNSSVGSQQDGRRLPSFQQGNGQPGGRTDPSLHLQPYLPQQAARGRGGGPYTQPLSSSGAPAAVVPPRFLYRTPATDGPGSPVVAGARRGGQGVYGGLPPVAPFHPQQQPFLPFHHSHQHQHQPSIAPSYHPSSHSPISPHAPLYPLVAPGVPIGPYAPSTAPGLPFIVGRQRKPGQGHRPTDSIGPPPKAKLGGASAATPTDAVGSGAAALAKKKKLVVKLPLGRSSAAEEGEPPLWVRAPMSTAEASIDDGPPPPPEVVSKEIWPDDEDDRTEVERGTLEVFLPSAHMWEKLKQDRFEAVMLAQGIDVRGEQDPFARSPSILSTASRSAAGHALGHRHSASLSHPRAPSFARPTHRSSPSVSHAIFGRPYPAPPGFNPEFGMSSALGRSADVTPPDQVVLEAERPDGESVINLVTMSGTYAPLPRKTVLLHSEFPEDATGPRNPASGAAADDEENGGNEHDDPVRMADLSPSYLSELAHDRRTTDERLVRAPVLIPGGRHARDLTFVGPALGGGRGDEDEVDWERASDYSDGSFSNPSDEEAHRQLRRQRHAPPATFGFDRQRRLAAPGDIISNPSDEGEDVDGDGGPFSQAAMSRLDARHASFGAATRSESSSPDKTTGAPNLNPRAPPFVIGRPSQPALYATPAFGSGAPRPIQLGSPVKLGEAPPVQPRPPPTMFNTATSSFSNAPTFFTALERSPPIFSRPAPSKPISIMPAPRPFNAAAPPFQPRFRPVQADTSQPYLDTPDGQQDTFRFVPPPGLLTLPPSAPETLSRSVGRPLPVPPAQPVGHLHEGDTEPGKRMRTEGPAARLDDDKPEGTLHLPASSPRKSPQSIRSIKDGSVDRMHVFRIPVGPVPPSPEEKLKQFRMPVSQTAAVTTVGNDLTAAVVSPLVAGESPERQPRSPEPHMPLTWQRSPIPDFGSPPRTLRSHAPPALPPAESATPARPLPTIPASTPIREVRLSLAGSVITDDEPSHRSACGFATPDRSGLRGRHSANPSSADASVYQPVQLEDLVRRIQSVLDDKLNSLRLAGTKSGVVHLASLHPDAEESLLGRLVAMLEDQNMLGGSEEVVRGAIEEGYRVVCERLEGLLTETLRSLDLTYVNGRSSAQHQAILSGIGAEAERSALILDHLEDFRERLDALATISPVATLDSASFESIQLAIAAATRGLQADESALANAVADALLPSLEEVRLDPAGLVADVAGRILPQLEQLGAESLTKADFGDAVSRILAAQDSRPLFVASEERIISTLSAKIAAAVDGLADPNPGLDIDVLVQCLKDALPVPATVNLSSVTVSLKAIKDDMARQQATTDGLTARLREMLREELAPLTELDAARQASESIFAGQLQASEVERTRLSAEAAKLRAAGLEHLALQSKAALAAQADSLALDEVRARLEVAEAEKAAALEREGAVKGENAEKTRELGKLRIKVNVLEAELEMSKREAGQAQRTWSAFQTTVERQLASLISAVDQGKFVEERSRDLSSELAIMEKRLGVAEEKLQSNQRAASAAAAVSKQAQATLQQRLSEADRSLKESALKLQEAEATVQSLKTSLDVSHNERSSTERRLAELEDALATARAEKQKLRSYLLPPRPETPRASQQQQRPLSASSWASPHPLVQQLQNQAHPLSPPHSTHKPSTQRPATVGAPAYPASNEPKGSMASMWAPQPQNRTTGLTSSGWTPPSRGPTPVSRPATVKPPDDSSDGWWSAA